MSINSQHIQHSIYYCKTAAVSIEIGLFCPLLSVACVFAVLHCCTVEQINGDENVYLALFV